MSEKKKTNKKKSERTHTKKEDKKDTESIEALKMEEEQIKNENKILKAVLIITGVVIILIVAWVIISKSVQTFKYENLNFQIVKEGDLIFYRIGLPTVYQGTLTEYSFYLRNDPRKLDVPFNGTLDLKSNAVLNLESDFQCGGKGVIAVANLVKLDQFLGINVISDENATCDPEARYTYIQVLEGNQTRIDQTGQSCYNIYINNCEILEGTEKFMIETLMKVQSSVSEEQNQ